MIRVVNLVQEKDPSITKFVIEWDTGKEKGSDNLLTKENLTKVGVAASDIKSIEPFFSFPGQLYTEEGVASRRHPCCGSAGVNILTNDSHRASIQDIFYHDQGHTGGAFQTVPHWNRERRFIDVNGNAERIPSDRDHILKDSESISISFVDMSENRRSQTIKSAHPKSE